MLMEALGASLTVLKEKAGLCLPVSQVSDMGLDIFRAIQGMASQGVAHRDIKPDNILIDGAGRYKLIDFGLACALPLAPEGLVGSPRYASLSAHRGQWHRASDL